MHLLARVNKDLYGQTTQTNAFLEVVVLVATFLDLDMIVTGRSALHEWQMNKCRFINRTNRSRATQYNHLVSISVPASVISTICSA
jgi:hypothetical protein